MTFSELPNSKKILVIANMLTAFAGFLIAVGSLIEVAENGGAIPNDAPRFHQHGSEIRARDYFGR